MLNFLQGPFIWVCLGVLVIGILCRVTRFFELTKRPGKRKFPLAKKEGVSLKYRWHVVEHSLVGKNLGLVFMTTLFHVLLVLTPLFVLGHNILLDFGIGMSLPSLPGSVTDLATVAVLVCWLFLVGRRFLMREVLAVTISDCLLLGITIAPFATGFMAYHQLGNYQIVIVVHMITGGLMLALIPFTRLSHCIYFFLNRTGRIWKTRESRVSAAFLSCMHCGFCAKSCFKYENDNRAEFAPVYKMLKVLKGNLGGLLLWENCELCTRCKCIMGIDIPGVISVGRDNARQVHPKYDERSV